MGRQGTVPCLPLALVTKALKALIIVEESTNIVPAMLVMVFQEGLAL